MARKGQVTPARRKITLETIEGHLKEQDREARRRRWVAFVGLGLSVMIAGVPLLLGASFGYVLLGYGFLMMLVGIVQASTIKLNSRVD